MERELPKFIEDNRVFICQIDLEDKIEAVNDEWLAFASENLSLLSKETVIDKVLWEFIGDPETRELYRCLLEKVRMRNAFLTIPFRCDSPDCRRFMELEIFAAISGSIVFRSRIVRMERRSYVELLAIGIERSNRLVKMCSWCKRVESGEVEWLEVEDAIQKLRLFDEEKLPQISHGVCPSCATSLLNGSEEQSTHRSNQ